MEFIDRFSTEAACRDFLVQLRWGDGFQCPRCRGVKGWSLKGRGLVQCAACSHQASVIASTIFQDTHKPLRLWFQAIWLVTSQKQGASALSLKQNLGLGSYETAWVWLHKLRAAMVRPDRERLQGPVEVDEATIGGVEEGLSGRQRNSKSLVAIAVEEEGRRGLGRIRMRRIDGADGVNLGTFVSDVVAAGSVVHTDAWQGYAGLTKRGYDHRPISVNAQGRGRQAAVELMPRVHLVVSLLKRWLVGTHQGAVSPEHLDYYLDEFCFRFNRRRSRRRGLLFLRLLENAVRIDPLPYEAIVERTGKPRNRRPRIGWAT